MITKNPWKNFSKYNEMVATGVSKNNRKRPVTDEPLTTNETISDQDIVHTRCCVTNCSISVHHGSSESEERRSSHTENLCRSELSAFSHLNSCRNKVNQSSNTVFEGETIRSQPVMSFRAEFAELLANELADRQLISIRGLAVDTYHLQHPWTYSNKLMHRNAIHLASLYCYFVKRIPAPELFKVRQKVMSQSLYFCLMTPPKLSYDINVSTVLQYGSSTEYPVKLREWAKYVFYQWRSFHTQIEECINAIDDMEQKS